MMYDVAQVVWCIHRVLVSQFPSPASARPGGWAPGAAIPAPLRLPGTRQGPGPVGRMEEGRGEHRRRLGGRPRHAKQPQQRAGLLVFAAAAAALAGLWAWRRRRAPRPRPGPAGSRSAFTFAAPRTQAAAPSTSLPR